jgi:hypothetical protein
MSHSPRLAAASPPVLPTLSALTEIPSDCSRPISTSSPTQWLPIMTRIFVFTFLIRNTNWTMSLYMYYVRDDMMGVDYGVVSAVGVFYLVPSLILYVAAQRYLMQMSIGGVKG